MVLSRKLSDKDKQDLYLEKKIKEKVSMIKRQTDYDDKTIIEKLKEHEYNTDHVIKEYMGIPLKKKDVKYTSTNKAKYTEIRKFMDNTYRDYRKRIELKNKQQEYLETISKKNGHLELVESSNNTM